MKLNELKLNKQNKITIFSVIFSILSIFLSWIVLDKIALIYVDDVMYANLMQNGLSYLFEQIKWHYINFNGRTWIHTFLSFLLLFKQHLYALIIPIAIFVSSYLLSTLAKPTFKYYEKLFISGFSVFLFWGIPQQFHTKTTFWMAGGINYIFPLLSVSLIYFIYHKARNNKKYIIPLIVLCCLSGATTEQYGMFMIGLIILSAFFDILNKEKQYWKINVLSLISTVIGYLTLFLSPGVSNKIENAKNNMAAGNFIDKFIANNVNLSAVVSVFVIPVIVLLFALVGINKKYKLLLIGIPVSLITLLLILFGQYLIASILFLLYMGLVSFVFLKDKDTRELGKLTVCGYGTFFMMTVNPEGVRMCLPFLITTIIVIAILYIDILLEYKNIKTFVIFLCLPLLVSTLNYNTINIDATIIKEDFLSPVYNEFSNAKNNHKINLDFDKMLRECEYNDIRYFSGLEITLMKEMKWYKEYFDIPDDISYQFYGEKYNLSNVKYNGDSYILPIINKDEKVYVPIHILSMDKYQVVRKMFKDGEFLGKGITDDDNSGYVINDEKIGFSIKKGKIVNTIKDLDVFNVELKSADVFYLEINQFCKLTKMEYEYNSTENTYNIFTK